MYDKTLTRQRPENDAAKRYFYVADKVELKRALEEPAKLHPEGIPGVDTGDEQFVEKALSRVDADAAKIMDLVCEKHEALYDKVNVQKLIIFLHNLAYRSEKCRSRLDFLSEQTIASMARLGIAPEQVEEMNRTGKEDPLYQLLGVTPVLKTAKMLTENYNWHN